MFKFFLYMILFITSQAFALSVPNEAAPNDEETIEQYGKVFTIFGTKKTRYGILKIVRDEDFIGDIWLDKKSVFPKVKLNEMERGYFESVVDIYQIGDMDVLLAKHTDGSAGGDATGRGWGYVFITLSANKRPVISDFFALGGVESSSAKLIGNQIIFESINVADDFENGNILLRKVIYENGKISSVRSKVNIQDETLSCKWLYDTYKYYLKNDCGRYNSYNEVCMTGGMSTWRGCRDYSGGFDEKKLAKAAKFACKNNSAINFTKFKLQVCGLK